MKIRHKSFGIKLWMYFFLFTSIIFAVLWLLQTVFLQSFYSHMAITNLKKTVREITGLQNENNFLSVIDEAAMNNSLLIFLTDENAEVLYSADEYSILYDVQGSKNAKRSWENPYFSDIGSMNWEKGVIRNLPYRHMELIAQLVQSDCTGMGYTTSDESAYVYAAKLSSCKAFPEQEVILCCSVPLGSIDAATGILRMELMWVSILSLVFACILAFFISRKFERPIQKLAFQAKQISRGEYETVEKTGFCAELDALADTLNETAYSLEKLENSRRELLTGISHDLRTPLTMMKGYAEMLQEFSWQEEQTRNHDLAVIQREADRLTLLVGEILEYSSMQINGLNLKIQTFDLSEIADNTAQQFEQLYKAHEYVIEKIVEPGLHVKGDKKQLERVMYNFIDNAVNHTSGEKHVIIKLCTVNDRVRFSVKDFGDGIPEEELPYIWDKYYTARKRKNKNTVSGLGLSISKEILIAHEAQFGVKCSEGCEFWFEITKQP